MADGGERSVRRLVASMLRVRGCRQARAVVALLLLLPAAGLCGLSLFAGDAASLASQTMVEEESQERTFITPEEETGGKFGSSVALSGNGSTVLVGAPYETGGPEQIEGPGAAWVFTRSGGKWGSKGSELTMPAADSEPGACGRETAEEATEAEGNEEAAHACRFGISVALSNNGEEAVIGAPHANENSGAVFIFTRSGSEWTLAAELGNPSAPAENRFGRSVSVSADGATVLVGAPMFHGAAWVFTRSGSTWTAIAKLENPAKSESGSGGDGRFGPAREGEGEGKGLFGQGVALSADGQTAVIGAPGYPGQKGAAWVFDNSGSSWSSTGSRLEVTPGSELPGETEAEKRAREEREGKAEVAARYGASVALSGDGDTALVGAQGYEGAGAAWVFTRAGTSWTEQGPMLTGAGEPEEKLGAGVALSSDGDSALVGAMHGNGHHGAAWLFTRSSAQEWSQQTELVVSTTPRVRFGSSVALSSSAETRLVGGRNSEHRGAAWVFGINPSVDAVEPHKGPAAGGTLVKISGEHFTEATSVRFGATEAASFNVTSKKSIEAISPAGSAGTVDVIVETPVGVSEVTSADEFTYTSKGEGGGGEYSSESNGGQSGSNANGSDAGPTKRSSTVVVLPFGPHASGACDASLLNRGIPVLRHDRALLRIRGTGRGHCSGKLTLRVKLRLAHSALRRTGHKSHKLQTIGTAAFTIAAGKRLSIAVRLNAVGRRLLRAEHGRLSASLLIAKSSPAPMSRHRANVRLIRRKHHNSGASKGPKKP
jgi:IPT/TIG domain/FG-GAP repeat